MKNFEEQENFASDASNSTKKQSIIERFKHMHFAMDDAQANKNLKITGLVLVSLLCLFVFVKTVNGIKEYNTIGEAPRAPYSITVSGHGEVMAKRDTASLSFSSFGEGKTTSEAQSKAAESNNKALAYLKSKGIPEKDISTQGYNTYPKYDQVVKLCPIIKSDIAPNGTEMAVAPIAPCNTYDQVISGYETTQTIEIKIRDIDQNPALSGEIVDGLAATGVRVGNFSNTIDDIEKLKSEARNQAIMDARIEARKIARSLGVRITKVVSYYDNNYGYPMAEGNVMSARAMDSVKSVAPELPAGEGKITSDVAVTFEIR
jgi:uncharacterized protein YggE